jgi:hypothetical protein
MEPETDTISCQVIRESEKAYLIRDPDDTREAWFPKSEVSFSRRNVKTGAATAIIPLWLLDAKNWNS